MMLRILFSFLIINMSSDLLAMRKSLDSPNQKSSATWIAVIKKKRASDKRLIQAYAATEVELRDRIRKLERRLKQAREQIDANDSDNDQLDTEVDLLCRENVQLEAENERLRELVPGGQPFDSLPAAAASSSPRVSSLKSSITSVDTPRLFARGKIRVSFDDESLEVPCDASDLFSESSDGEQE